MGEFMKRYPQLFSIITELIEHIRLNRISSAMHPVPDYSKLLEELRSSSIIEMNYNAGQYALTLIPAVKIEEYANHYFILKTRDGMNSITLMIEKDPWKDKNRIYVVLYVPSDSLLPCVTELTGDSNHPDNPHIDSSILDSGNRIMNTNEWRACLKDFSQGGSITFITVDDDDDAK